MNTLTRLIGFTFLTLLAQTSPAADPPLAEYFRVETARLAARPLGSINSAEAWKQARPELQRRLRAMLGLDPLPEKTDLQARITGVVERPDFLVEKLLFQSRPGLYVTGNLYRPKEVKSPLPAILYVCGHSKVEKDGVIYGSKAHYQHHAAWYAANGYVCLVLDTLQLGELPGLHHGTYRERMWWWQSRGYTPAGVEAWNGVRAIDYLLTRPEVDPKKIGVTGRSGGGATSWWLGAIDDRIAAVVPVAGITDMTNHIVDGANKRFPDGVIEGHCDCMYFVNTYRWDFPLVAALVAPKAMLVENTDADPIFPEDGVRRVYEQARKVYGWYDASDKLGLVIGKGGHVDSEEIRHPSFAFMNKWLRGVETPITEPDRKVPIEELKVLKPDEVPPNNQNATIHETFVAKAEEPPVPQTAEAWEKLKAEWMKEVREKVFAGWPDAAVVVDLDVKTVQEFAHEGMRLRAFEFTSQPGVRLRLWYLVPEGGRRPDALRLFVLDTETGKDIDNTLSQLDHPRPQPKVVLTALAQAVTKPGEAVAFLSPRGSGWTSWPPERDAHIRRRFALLGQTLDGMRVWDVRRAWAALREVPDLRGCPTHLEGHGQSAPIALWATVFEPEVASLTLGSASPEHPLPATVRDGPSLLNLEQILGLPQALALLHPRPVILSHEANMADWRWARDLAQKLSPGRPWPEQAKARPFRP